jgi:hypothetical protein
VTYPPASAAKVEGAEPPPRKKWGLQFIGIGRVRVAPFQIIAPASAFISCPDREERSTSIDVNIPGRVGKKGNTTHHSQPREDE